MCQASAFADAGNVFRSAQADRWLKAFAPIEIGLSRRDAPGVGLRRRGERLWPAQRWSKAFAPIEIGLPRRDAPGVGLRRRGERLWPAQADHRPKASGG
jgi:hypothetical protein